MSKRPNTIDRFDVMTFSINDETRADEDLYELEGNIGVKTDSRDSGLTITIAGVAPVKMADGVTVAVGSPIKNDGAGLGTLATVAGEAYVGFSLDAIASTSDDYIRMSVAPANLV